ncbi:class I SAM-dependent methyltransferase [Nostoc sp. UHCC 0870]|uniref:class I SAM-dependent methyltransferase n=1 Tax=Nostoc sp. UHCC 0870 TaxID=2914041 RepID=UPI001EDFF000|nr:methionine biosynthesis protein MetW [Nostoc sp. UHCC 0870]UKO98441.1 methyltransferase domain-containing protein [Nostoc sp. UHCC 0870]
MSINESKFELIRNHVHKKITNNSQRRLSLLDVGCRDCKLKKYIGDVVDYKGVDLFQNSEGTVDFVLNVEDGLPIADKTYDFVVALDLVEHLNNVQESLHELLRVSRRHLIIMLPNMAYAPLRKEFLIKGTFSDLTDKYDLTYGSAHKGVDRHRWLTVIPQTDNYIKEFAVNNNLHLDIVWFTGSQKRVFFETISKLLNLSPSWWATASLYVLTKP